MGLIPNDVIEEIRHRADIVAIIGQHIALRKAGQNHKGLCPFHQEKTPSFHVNGDKHFFYCFGCQKKGDIFSFLMEFEGKSFVEVAESLAASLGIELVKNHDSAAQQQQRTERSQMLEACKVAAGFYHKILADPGSNAARTYIQERGLDRQTVENFQLGFAPNEWSCLVDHLREQGISSELAQKVGLLVPQKHAGGVYDRFRNRLMCPVILPGGEIAGFSGRLIGDVTDKTGAKYINSPESPIYKKSKLLFGLHRAREAFRQRGRAILVEGNFDVISLHQAGFAETVAALGTALTEIQVDLLRRFGVRVILLYDGDNAGRAASLKSLRSLLTGGVETYIAALPDGQDPDNYNPTTGLRGSSEPVRSSPARGRILHP